MYSTLHRTQLGLWINIKSKILSAVRVYGEKYLTTECEKVRSLMQASEPSCDVFTYHRYVSMGTTPARFAPMRPRITNFGG